jgi:hypothetical protein
LRKYGKVRGGEKCGGLKVGIGKGEELSVGKREEG